MRSPLNKDDLVAEHRARFGIEQAAGADRDALRRRSLHVHAGGVEWSRFRASILRLEACGAGGQQDQQAREVDFHGMFSGRCQYIPVTRMASGNV